MSPLFTGASHVIGERDLPGGSSQLVVVRSDGSGPERVIDTGCADSGAAKIIPGWTHDGRHITFSRVVGPLVNGNAASAVLYTADLDGSHIRRLSEPGYRWCVRELLRQIRGQAAF